jgi:hypothetical protein
LIVVELGKQVLMDIRCELCSEESSSLVPVLDRDPTSFQEHSLVCSECAEIAAYEHTALWNVRLFNDHGKVILPSLLSVA